MEAEYEISAVYFPHPSELELTWKDIQTGEEAFLTIKVTKEQGEMVSRVVPPCVYLPATRHSQTKRSIGAVMAGGNQ